MNIYHKPQKHRALPLQNPSSAQHRPIDTHKSPGEPQTPGWGGYVRDTHTHTGPPTPTAGPWNRCPQLGPPRTAAPRAASRHPPPPPQVPGVPRPQGNRSPTTHPRGVERRLAPTLVRALHGGTSGPSSRRYPFSPPPSRDAISAAPPSPARFRGGSRGECVTRRVAMATEPCFFFLLLLPPPPPLPLPGKGGKAGVTSWGREPSRTYRGSAVPFARAEGRGQHQHGPPGPGPVPPAPQIPGSTGRPRLRGPR